MHRKFPCRRLGGFALLFCCAGLKIDFCRADVTPSCTFASKQLFGRVQVVTSFPDVKIQIVNSFPDLKVQTVTSFPTECGKWQMVDTFPDLKIQFVESFPDIKIQYVDSFPGLPHK